MKQKSSRVTHGLLRKMPSSTHSVTESDSSVSTADGVSAAPAEVGGYSHRDGGERLSTIHSLRDQLDSSEGDSGGDKELEDNALAREVGLNSRDYLDECFYTEELVLKREPFEDLPQMTRSDLTIKGRLGKGSYCEVFDVVCKGSQKVHGKTSIVPPRSVAMKCLRPQVQSNAEQFTMGAEDLVHETAILANLSHRHVVKIYGRAEGRLTDVFPDYFVLLERLHETLHDRLEAWKGAGVPVPAAQRTEVALAVAEATAYLHSKNILFRDLKPENVGFDGRGVPKLFDFGFAVGLPRKDDENPEGLLYDKCGTPRYMAPEVGLSRGYGTEADAYSFGILLWETWAMERPFASITLPADFDRAVFRGGRRPALNPLWPAEVRALIARCWSAAPGDRPAMAEVGAALSPAASGRRKKMSAMKNLRSSLKKMSTMKNLRSRAA